MFSISDFYLISAMYLSPQQGGFSSEENDQILVRVHLVEGLGSCYLKCKGESKKVKINLKIYDWGVTEIHL